MNIIQSLNVFPSFSYRNSSQGYEEAGHLTTQEKKADTRSESMRGVIRGLSVYVLTVG